MAPYHDYKKFSQYLSDGTDPKVPTWNMDSGVVGLKNYEKDVLGYKLGKKEEDWELVAPRLWRFQVHVTPCCLVPTALCSLHSVAAGKE